MKNDRYVSKPFSTSVNISRSIFRVVISVVAIGTGVLATSAAFASSLSGPFNPSSNVTPSPNILSSGSCTESQGSYTCTNPCVTSQLTFPVYTNDPTCTNYELEAINNALALEKVSPMVLPSNWYTLSVPQQLFVIADLERVLRGYPPYLGLNSSLSTEAQNAAASGTDPGLAPGFATGNNADNVTGFGGAWGEGDNPLVADFYWMYSDGWGGSASTTSNIGCTSPTASACWGHRDQLLGADPALKAGVGLDCTTCEMGTGFATYQGFSSYVDLVELPAASPPVMTFTWASELPFFPANALPTTTTTSTVSSPVTPSKPSIRRQTLSLSSAKVSWTSATSEGIERASLVLSKSSSCSTTAASWSAAFAPSQNVTTGSLGGTSKNAFSPAGLIYARVTVTNAAGSARSACQLLGRS